MGAEAILSVIKGINLDERADKYAKKSLISTKGDRTIGYALNLTIENNIIHPTINYETPDPECDLDYVPNKARKATVNLILSNSAGFGSRNSALIIKRYRQ